MLQTCHHVALVFLTLALALPACGPDANPPPTDGGGGSATASSSGPSSATGAACLTCSAFLTTGAALADVPLLCPSSAALWKDLTWCACDTEPMPPPGGGQCAGPCTYHPTDAGSWCDALVTEPTCLACLSSSPVGCSAPLAACQSDK